VLGSYGAERLWSTVHYGKSQNFAAGSDVSRLGANNFLANLSAYAQSHHGQNEFADPFGRDNSQKLDFITPANFGAEIEFLARPLDSSVHYSPTDIRVYEAVQQELANRSGLISQVGDQDQEEELSNILDENDATMDVEEDQSLPPVHRNLKRKLRQHFRDFVVPGLKRNHEGHVLDRLVKEHINRDGGQYVYVKDKSEKIKSSGILRQGDLKRVKVEPGIDLFNEL